MDISIIICTYNRAYNLPECFDCLAKQENISGISWGILLVDNNSSDDTPNVVEQYAAHSHLNIRYIFEKTQGLSYARNRGISQANSTWVAFIDDDIRVSEKWLHTLYTTFDEHDCDAVGGRIHIESPSALPKWVTPDMYGFLGHQDFGAQPHEMDGIEESPFGGNMAVHRRVFNRIGMFDTTLGRKGAGGNRDELFKGEETDFFERLAAVGGTFYYHPDILVLHKILPYQLKRRFFLTLHRNSGFLAAQRDNDNYNRTLAGIPLFVLMQFSRATWRYFINACTKGPANAYRLLMNAAYFWGMITAYKAKASKSP